MRRLNGSLVEMAELNEVGYTEDPLRTFALRPSWTFTQVGEYVVKV
jgi:hypothetical protein